jgi:hypothetical protein
MLDIDDVLLKFALLPSHQTEQKLEQSNTQLSP